MNHNGNCHVPAIQKDPTAEELAKSEPLILRVAGMGCVNCATRVRNALVSQDGVLAAEVDHKTGLAKVRHNPDYISTEAVLNSVAAAGNDNHHDYRAVIVQ